MNYQNPFGFPENCAVAQRIPKTSFLTHALLNLADRRMVQSEIENIYCSYVLKSENIFLASYFDEEREYDSFTVIDVTLRKTSKVQRIAQLFHRVIPYPVLLIFHFVSDLDVESSLFSMALKRISRDGRELIVLEREIITPWLAHEKLEEFYREANFTKFQKRTFRDLYEHYINLLETLLSSVVTGKFCPELDPQVRRKNLEQLHKLEQEMALLRVQVKKESELSSLVEYNLKFKKLESQRIQILKLLS